jgi:orotate phosphoribosyltransferase
VLRGSFRLRSGATSSYYIDKYLFTTRPKLLRQLAAALAVLVPHGVDRLAGPVLGAIPLVTALSLQIDLPTLLIRTERKEYGTAKQIEGSFSPGERVLLVEDVVTTGGAGVATVAVLREAGLTVLKAICVVDREEGGAAAFAQHDVPFQALFTTPRA